MRIHNGRGACLAGAVVTDTIRPGVVQLATGAWFDPLDPAEIGSLDKHGNPNVLTLDKGTSKLAQCSSAQTALVEVERFAGQAASDHRFRAPGLRAVTCLGGCSSPRTRSGIWLYMVVWLGMVKVTFTLDDQTVDRLRRTAARLARPQSYVVREAIKEYEARSTKLSDEERARMLAILDRIVQEPPTRTAAEVDRELDEIRAARRRWGRHKASRRPS